MVDYVSVPEAVGLTGLRVVFSPGLPGPWSVAARMILDLKRIPFIPVAQTVGARDKVLRDWTGQESAPVAVLDGERGRSRWDEILLLAERLAPEPTLVHADEARRAEMFGLAQAICGEDGFGWNFRLYQMAGWEDALAGRSSAPVFFDREQLDIMQSRYGDPSRSRIEARERMVSILKLLSERLRSSRSAGGGFLLGDALTAVDIYWAAFSTLVSPIRHDYCPMPDVYRQMCEAMGQEIGGALDPALVDHRDRILQSHCTLPLQF